MISKQEAMELFASDDLIGIGMEADAIRRNVSSVTRCTVDEVAVSEPVASFRASITPPIAPSNSPMA